MSSGARTARTLLVSDFLPGPRGGAAIILDSLLESFPYEALWILTSPEGVAHAEPIGSETRRSWRYDLLRPWPSLWGSGRAPARAWNRLLPRFGTIFRICLIPVHSAQIIKHARAHDIEVILAVPSGSGETCIAAYLAHRWTGCSLYFFAMDDWQSNARLLGGRISDRLVGMFMKRIATAASRMWAVSSQMADGWRQSYGAHVDILLPSVEIHPPAPVSPRSPGHDRFVGVVASIYWVNVHEFRCLLEAIETLRADGERWKVHLFTVNPESVPMDVATNDCLEISCLPGDELRLTLVHMDILFLGLTFAPQGRRTVEVAFPTKIPEYLATGQPILVNAPAYAEASKYVKENDCGLVVSSPRSEDIVAAIRLLTRDHELQRRLAENGRQTLVANHDRAKISKRFLAEFTR